MKTSIETKCTCIALEQSRKTLIGNRSLDSEFVVHWTGKMYAVHWQQEMYRLLTCEVKS